MGTRVWDCQGLSVSPEYQDLRALKESQDPLVMRDYKEFRV